MRDKDQMWEASGSGNKVILEDLKNPKHAG